MKEKVHDIKKTENLEKENENIKKEGELEDKEKVSHEKLQEINAK